MQRLTLVNPPPGSFGPSTARRDTSLGVNQIPLAVVGNEQSQKALFVSNFVGRLESDVGEMKRRLDLERASYELRILTSVGFEGYFFLYEESWLNAQGFIFVYNVCSRESFNYFGVFKERLFRLKQTERMPMLLVGFSPEGNEEMREVSTEEGKKVAEKGGFLFQEIIGVDKGKIDEAFNTSLQEILNFYAGRTTGASAPSWAFDATSGEIIEFERIPECRVLVAGDCFVGKTTMIQLLSNQPNTQPSSKYSSTSTLEVTKHEFQHDKEAISVTVIDSPGWWEANDFASAKEEITFVQGILLVFSVLSRDSFLRVEQLAKTLLSVVGKSKLPMVLIGHKAEPGLEYRNVSCEEGVGLAKRLECMYFETSLVKRDNIKQAFANLAKSVNTHMSASSEVFKLYEEDLQRAGTLQMGDKTGKKWTQQSVEVDVGSLISEGGKLVVSLHSAMVEIDDSLNGPGRFAFVVTIHDKKFLLAAGTEEERKNWVTCIKVNAAIAEVASSIIEETIHKILSEHLPKGLRLGESPRSGGTGGDLDGGGEDVGTPLSTSLSFSGVPSLKEASSNSAMSSSSSSIQRKKKGLFNSLRRGSLSGEVLSSSSSSSSLGSPRSPSSKKDDKKTKKG